MPNEAANTTLPKRRFLEFREKDGWEIKPLGAIFSERQESNRIELPLLSLTDKEGIIPQEESNRRNTSNADKKKYLRVSIGDIAYNTMRMWEGRSAFVTMEGIISPAYTVCQPKDNVDGLFFSYYFKTSPLIEQFHKYSQGLVKDTLNLKFQAFSKILAAVPSLPEQQKIADTLSSLDTLLAAHRAKLTALQAHKRGLLQDLFPAPGQTRPKRRFPEFQDAGEWVEKTFAQLFEIGSGKDYKHLGKGNIPVYGSGGYMLSVDDYLYEGDSVCIGRKGTIDKPMYLSGKFWTVDTLFYTHSFEDCLPKFIYLLFQKVEWSKHNEGGGVPSLSKSIIGGIKVHIPSEIEQQKISDCLTTLDKLITAQNQKIEALQLHKKGLMQALFPSTTLE